MKLNKLLEGIVYKKISGNTDLEIQEIFYDSRKGSPDSLFVCIKGLNTDGHQYIDSAIKNGAKAVAVCDEKYFPEKPLLDVTYILVDDCRKELASLTWNLFGKSWEKMDIIGITGTNGKTSTAFILHSILEKIGIKSGLIGTIHYIVDGEKLNAARTTPESLDLGRLFKKMVKSYTKCAVMEVTSHAIALDRVHGIKFKRAVFTNLTHDHLDFHKNMDDYRETKFRLFQMLKDKGSDKSIIANQDDPSTNLIKDMYKNEVLTFGLNSNSDVYPSDLDLSPAGSKFKLNTPKWSIPIESRLIGYTAVYNILAAAGAAYSLDLKPEMITEGIKEVVRIPGRLDPVDMNQDFFIFIDYAHTPDALQRALIGLREICKGKIITVFGCGGDRDKTKRPVMGTISAKYSDFSVITNDNPRTEDPIKIIEMIEESFIKEGSKEYVIEPDRAEAIKYALNLAKEKDTLLIAGKGHENYQLIGNKVLHFDDREIVMDIMKGIK